MRHEAHIQEQAQLARQLSEERSQLFEQVPFARQLERNAPELKRITRPVVAVVGAARVGKSTLLRALGADVPWKWLEVEPGGSGGGGLSVGELAEHCLLVLTAGEAPSREVRAWLPWLAEVFPEGSLQLVLTRGDALPRELSGVLSAGTAHEQLEQVLREAVPQRTLPVLTVSGTTGEGLEALREALAEALARRQRVLLEEALKDWSGVLADVHTLLGMRELAKLRPETLTRLRLSLDELLREESGRLEGELPRLAEESLRELESRLPEAQRALTRAFREKLSARVEPRSQALRQRLDEVLARELARDIEGKTGGKAHVELADRFGRLVEPRSLFFDWGFAKTGGVAGVGAAMVAGVARKHGGWAVLGAALLGGVLAGLLGKGTRVNTAEELKRVVAEPLLEDSLRRLKEATESSRADVERLCGLLRKVAEIFSPEHARAYDVERLGQAITEAEGRREQLGRELTELQWKDTRA